MSISVRSERPTRGREETYTLAFPGAVSATAAVAGFAAALVLDLFIGASLDVIASDSALVPVSMRVELRVARVDEEASAAGMPSARLRCGIKNHSSAMIEQRLSSRMCILWVPY